MARHRQQPVRKWAPYVTTGLALEVATLFAFAYATDSHVAVNPLLSATTSIFVDGTKSITGREEGNPPYRMADSFLNAYDQTPNIPDDETTGGDNKFVVYPRSLGPLTGIGDPTYDASEGDATTQTVALVKKAREDNPNDKIYVVGYSQGAGAASQAMQQLETDGFDTGNVEFVLAANPRRTDGGILARLPKGVYVPILGVSFGDGTSPTNPNTHVLQVTKQYDGVADAPNYIFNVVADLNAIMGFYYLHSGYYKDVDPNDPTAIVTHSADGTVTDVLIPAKLGELPLTMPLLQLGVPRSVVEALDPFLRAVIETGYARPSVVPSQPVPFTLLPPPNKWLPDLQAMGAGAVQTGQALAGLNTQPSTTLQDNKQKVTALVEPAGAEDTVAPSPTATPDPPLATPDPSPTVVEVKPEPSTTSTPDGPPPPVKKSEPPRKPLGGWKPGDLLRGILHPKPRSGDAPAKDHPTSSPKPSAAPSPPSAGPNDPPSGVDGDTTQSPAAA